MDVLVVLNPHAARHSDEVRQALEEGLRARGLTPRVVEVPREDACDAIAGEVDRALAQGCSRFVAAGGDGTIGLVAEAIARADGMRRGARLGLVPTGTANVLAHELGIPGDPGAAAELVAAERTLDLDAIRAADHHVLTQVGVGPDAIMIQETRREERRRRGRLAYVLSFARRALRHRPRRFRLEVDGSGRRVWAWQVVVANVGTAGTSPFTWGPGIDPTDGVMDLCVFDLRGPADYLELLLRVLTGRHRRDRKSRFVRARETIRIAADRPLLVQGDGELIGRTPIQLRIVPGWVRVFVPEPAPAAPASGPHGAAAPTATAGAAESVQQDVQEMIAERSPTWVLQGPWRHPLTALGAFDAALFLRVNALPLGRAADHALSAISRLMHYGEGWIAVGLAAILIDPRSGLRIVAEAAPVLGLTMLTVNFPLKALFRRRRPFHSFVDARVVGVRPRDFSFPSGHTAAACAGALLFTTHFPAAAPAFFGLAAVVGFSRVYLGVHYPSDVLMGALFGTALAAGYRALLGLALRAAVVAGAGA